MTQLLQNISSQWAALVLSTRTRELSVAWRNLLSHLCEQLWNWVQEAQVGGLLFGEMMGLCANLCVSVHLPSATLKRDVGPEQMYCVHFSWNIIVWGVSKLWNWEDSTGPSEGRFLYKYVNPPVCLLSCLLARSSTTSRRLISSRGHRVLHRTLWEAGTFSVTYRWRWME